MAIIMAEKTPHTFWNNTNMANDNCKIQVNAYATVLEAYAGGATKNTDLVYFKLREIYLSLRDPKSALLHQR